MKKTTSILHAIKSFFLTFWKWNVLFFLLLAVVLFQNQWYQLRSKQTIPTHIENRLKTLGEKALLHQDVPVAAIVLYNDSIIGEGYNTVYKDGDLSAHAEINALNQAFRKNGLSFKTLNKDKLVLYSTYEPCEMCKGTILHYGIENIYFEQQKPAFQQIGSLLRHFLYNIKVQRLDAPNLQEDLFEKHPAYPLRKKNEEAQN